MTCIIRYLPVYEKDVTRTTSLRFLRGCEMFLWSIYYSRKNEHENKECQTAAEFLGDFNDSQKTPFFGMEGTPHRSCTCAYACGEFQRKSHGRILGLHFADPSCVPPPSAPDFCRCWIQPTYETGEAVANYATRSSVIFGVAPRWIRISLLPPITLSRCAPMLSDVFYIPLKLRSQQASGECII